MELIGQQVSHEHQAISYNARRESSARCHLLECLASLVAENWRAGMTGVTSSSKPSNARRHDILLMKKTLSCGSRNTAEQQVGHTQAGHLSMPVARSFYCRAEVQSLNYNASASSSASVQDYCVRQRHTGSWKTTAHLLSSVTRACVATQCGYYPGVLVTRAEVARPGSCSANSTG